MKKFLSVLLILLIASSIFVIAGCKEKKTEENAEERNMEITIQGKTNDKTVVNPVFDWTNPHDDKSFSVLLENGDEERILSFTTESTHLELADNLKYATDYTLTVTGAESSAITRIAFTTIDGPATKAELKEASFSVSEPYKSHMVIQRGKPIEIAGKTAANVLVTLDFRGALYYAISDDSGAFLFTLPSMDADPAPSTLKLRLLKEKELVLEDVLIGDVYLVSGQSNMWFPLQGITERADYLDSDVDDAVAYDVRYFSQDNNTSTSPIDTTKRGKWFKVDKKDTGYTYYSAIGFMLGAMLGKELSSQNVPVGIVYAAQGSTFIEEWIGKEYYDGSNASKNLHYNAMIYPLRHTELAGVVWYQGCNNSAAGAEYDELLGKLFSNWRNLFGNDALPFYVVQLPVFDGDSGNSYDFSFVREAQLKACEADENSYLIATCDGGDPKNIHPSQKRYIAERLTKSILSTIYGTNYLPQGPTYASHTVEGNKAIVTVKYGEGLHTKNGESIVGFLLAGADGKYFDATAVIEDGKIVVTSDKLSTPVYIKYGFSKSPYLNLYNKDGFLMSPFRTDVLNRGIDLLDYTESAKYSSHKDGSTMSHTVVTTDGKVGIEITKANDGKTFGSLILDKWGAIGCDELGMKLTLRGDGSGVTKALLRFVEGSYEIWAYDFTEKLTGNLEEFTIPTAAFRCAGNAINGVIDYEKIMDVEITIEATSGATVTIYECKFVEVARTQPVQFTLKEARNDSRNCTISYTRSVFANDYRILVSANGTNYANPIVDQTTQETQYTFDASLCAANTVYYVKVIARNELGETVAEESGMTMRSLERYVISDLTFSTDAKLKTFVSNKMAVHANLAISRRDKGIKINVKEKGDWMHCIVNTDQGTNKGYDTLKFYMDLREYQGERVVVQLQDKEYKSYSCTLNLSSKREGYFEIPFNSFSGFTGQDVIRIAYNFVDYIGGEEDSVYLADLEYIKK